MTKFSLITEYSLNDNVMGIHQCASQAYEITEAFIQTPQDIENLRELLQLINSVSASALEQLQSA